VGARDDDVGGAVRKGARPWVGPGEGAGRQRSSRSAPLGSPGRSRSSSKLGVLCSVSRWSRSAFRISSACPWGREGDGHDRRGDRAATGIEQW